jgi:CheY-like chemotaxis protein
MLEEIKSLRIAVVDDDKDLSEIYSKVLQKLGYPTPSVFNDGTSLVRALMANRDSFDLIIMDYRMPEMNGIEAAKIIQRYRKNVKIIMLSAYESVREKADDIGVPFLQKPFSMDQLSRCLDNIRLVNPEA